MGTKLIRPLSIATLPFLWRKIQEFSPRSLNYLGLDEALFAGFQSIYLYYAENFAFLLQRDKKSLRRVPDPIVKVFHIQNNTVAVLLWTPRKVFRFRHINSLLLSQNGSFRKVMRPISTADGYPYVSKTKSHWPFRSLKKM